MEVQGCYGEVQALGGEVVVVSFAPAERLGFYRQELGWPFPVVGDPERKAYEAFGLEPTKLRALLRPRVFREAAALVWRGVWPKVSGGGDVYQLGGDFVVDRGRRLTYAHRSADPADRPKARELVRVLREAAGRPGDSAPGPAEGSS